jgi:hypothetical protein
MFGGTNHRFKERPLSTPNMNIAKQKFLRAETLH